MRFLIQWMRKRDSYDKTYFEEFYIKRGVEKIRNSSVELFRIISMLIIIAHHYVVNSGLLEVINESNHLEENDIFLLLFGWGGKTGINCFILVTGYYMCTSKITLKKYIKLLSERYFYAIVFFFIFLVTGYMTFSIKDFLKVLIPFFNISDGFVSCFLLFYLLIPFLNKLIKVLNEKEHAILLLILLFIYTILPSFMKATVTFNYVTWFCVLYFIASFLRLYSKKWMENTRLWAALTIISLLLSWTSVVLFAYIGKIIKNTEITYFLVSDSNKVLALTTGITAFMLFKNIKLKQHKWINLIASSTFGVLLIHANSDAMRQWLWKDMLQNVTFYNSSYLILHAIISVLVVFVVCTIIDQIRIKLIENPMMRLIWKEKV
ncbi:MAG: acyltransferase [Lachnospiraceae bacterium]|nr:acyltransferase [Lachnospiraceae bacterium]MCI8826670.1 acyltransferase [Lachnospiraceae bacterium]